MAMRSQHSNWLSPDSVRAIVGFPLKPAAPAVIDSRRHQRGEGPLTITVVGYPQAISNDSGPPRQRDHFAAGRERANGSCVINYLRNQYLPRVIGAEPQQQIMDLGDRRFGLGIRMHQALIVERGEPVIYGRDRDAETCLNSGVVLQAVHLLAVQELEVQIFQQVLIRIEPRPSKASFLADLHGALPDGLADDLLRNT
jgi:hypothetical protein